MAADSTWQVPTDQGQSGLRGAGAGNCSSRAVREHVPDWGLAGAPLRPP